MSSPSCTICLEDLGGFMGSTEITDVSVLACGHAYHYPCIKKWSVQCSRHKKPPVCPSCKKTIEWCPARGIVFKLYFHFSEDQRKNDYLKEIVDMKKQLAHQKDLNLKAQHEYERRIKSQASTVDSWKKAHSHASVSRDKLLQDNAETGELLRSCQNRLLLESERRSNIEVERGQLRKKLEQGVSEKRALEKELTRCQGELMKLDMLGDSFREQLALCRIELSLLEDERRRGREKLEQEMKEKRALETELALRRKMLKELEDERRRERKKLEQEMEEKRALETELALCRRELAEIREGLYSCQNHVLPESERWSKAEDERGQLREKLEREMEGRSSLAKELVRSREELSHACRVMEITIDGMKYEMSPLASVAVKRIQGFLQSTQKGHSILAGGAPGFGNAVVQDEIPETVRTSKYGDRIGNLKISTDSPILAGNVPRFCDAVAQDEIPETVRTSKYKDRIGDLKISTDSPMLAGSVPPRFWNAVVQDEIPETVRTSKYEDCIGDLKISTDSHTEPSFRSDLTCGEDSSSNQSFSPALSSRANRSFQSAPTAKTKVSLGEISDSKVEPSGGIVLLLKVPINRCRGDDDVPDPVANGTRIDQLLRQAVARVGERVGAEIEVEKFEVVARADEWRGGGKTSGGNRQNYDRRYSVKVFLKNVRDVAIMVRMRYLDIVPGDTSTEIEPDIGDYFCRKCFEMDHLSAVCKKEARELPCKRCGKVGHFINDREKGPCKLPAECKLCRRRGIKNVNHPVGASICSTLRKKRQDLIQIKVDELLERERTIR